MKIGVIGAGNIGGTLVRRFTALGHEVLVANSRGPETLADLAQETGAKAATIQSAAGESDVVVITIPEGRIPKLPKDLFAGSMLKTVVVDTGNYYPNGNEAYGREADGFIAEIEAGTPESRWVEEQLGHPVVKAFNTIIADDLMHRGRAKGAADRIALPISGDDSQAKDVVTSLLDQLGFDTVDVGGLDESWRHQPGTPVYVKRLDVEELERALAEASPNRTPEWKAAKA